MSLACLTIPCSVFSVFFKRAYVEAEEVAQLLRVLLGPVFGSHSYSVAYNHL